MPDFQSVLRPAIIAATPMASQAVGTAVTAATGNPLIGQAAATATPMVIDSATNYILGDKGSNQNMPQQLIPSANQARFMAGAAPEYNTNQADLALRNNANLVNAGSRQIAEQANADYNQRAGSDLARQIGYQQTVADMGNAAANANLARNMALNNQTTLNQQYAQAGDRLNQAAATTQNALNNAASTVAGLFR